MQPIHSTAKNLHNLLGGDAHFTIPDFQREYRWTKDHVGTLIDDLYQAFDRNRQETATGSRTTTAIDDLEHYFLGSIIVARNSGALVDGQQRITTLTLLLMCLFHSLTDNRHYKLRTTLGNLICMDDEDAANPQFRLHVEERDAAMSSLFDSGAHVLRDASESVNNLVLRYEDIDNGIAQTLHSDDFPAFARWLTRNVWLVEIKTESDTEAHSVFEAMNDRGLSIGPTEMLKSFLLSNIEDNANRQIANAEWRRVVQYLRSLEEETDSNLGGDTNALKAWLRARYAVTIRDRTRHAERGDFDHIGTLFHRWIRDNLNKVDLSKPADYLAFITQRFSLYAKWYGMILDASRSFSEALPSVYYNSLNNFTLQNTVLLAPLQEHDSDEDARLKMNIVSTYLDMVIARRIWNGRATSYSHMHYNMFQLITSIRTLVDIDELAHFLSKQVRNIGESFSNNDVFSLHRKNRPQIHYILARIADFIDTQSGSPSQFTTFTARKSRDPYQIEHILPNTPEHLDSMDFEDEDQYSEWRNRIGALLLLPRSFNASYGKMPYRCKVEKYIEHGFLAKSLHPAAYKNNPGFSQFCDRSSLNFRSFPEFTRSAISERQSLYRDVAEIIWSADRLIDLASSTSE